jgi:hypothetical protein
MESHFFFKKKEDLHLAQEQQLHQDILYFHLLMQALNAQMHEQRMKKYLMFCFLKYFYHRQRRRQHQLKRWHLSSLCFRS